MNIDKIRKYIFDNKGKTFSFKFNGSRNQVDEFIGIINKTYNSIFTINVIGKYPITKSYSYNDILINNLEMKEIVMKN